MRAPIAMLVLVLGCESGGGTGAAPTDSKSAKPASGSGKGFGADLLRELESTGSGSGDAKVADAKAGSGSAAKPADPPKPAAGSADAKAGSGDAKVADAKAGSADAKVADAKAGSAAKPADPPKPAIGSAAKPPDPKPPDPKPPDPKPPDPKDTKVVITEPKPPVAVSAELKEIKLALLPNWERDVDQAGTISLAVKVQGRPQPAVFRFRYGYEDAKAPADRDAYKKWLAENKLLVPRQDRQAGAAWFIEGTDGSGSPAFRVVVNYGGRKLICGGSLYKDAESNKLGDLRDQTIIQAKQICESVAL
jgi:hypothetical protein